MGRKGCSNCYWYPKCDHTERCDYYDPVISEDGAAKNEYWQALKERVETAKELELEMGEQ